MVLCIAAYFIVTSYSGQKFAIHKNNIQNVRRELYRDLYTHGGLIIYPVSKPEYKSKYLKAAHKFQGFFRRFNLQIKSDSQVTDSDLKNKSIFIIGSFNANRVLQKIADKLPVNFSGNAFEYHGVKYSNSSDVISVFYRNPFNKNKMCYIFSGVNDKYIAQDINFSLISDIRVMQGEECAAMGFFKI